MTEANNHSKAVAEAKIEISLNRLGQLFNSFDPSPFHERDLDQDAEEYIIGSAEEVARRPLCLVVHLPADQVPNPAVTDLGASIHTTSGKKLRAHLNELVRFTSVCTRSRRTHT